MDAQKIETVFVSKTNSPFEVEVRPLPILTFCQDSLRGSKSNERYMEGAIEEEAPVDYDSSFNQSTSYRGGDIELSCSSKKRPFLEEDPNQTHSFMDENSPPKKIDLSKTKNNLMS